MMMNLGYYRHNPCMSYWKTFLNQKTKTWPEQCSKMMRNNGGLLAFIWARYAVVCCLREDISSLDPSGGEALRLVM